MAKRWLLPNEDERKTAAHPRRRRRRRRQHGGRIWVSQRGRVGVW